MALRVHDTPNGDVFDVSGRGELHLGILLENMRREGYELAVGRPRVVKKTINGVECEPYELLTVDVEEEHQGGVMEASACARARCSTWCRMVAVASVSNTAFRRAA
jgi:GTP-binding protein